MPGRLPLLLGLALCGIAHAAPPPQLELTATAAWKGWTRPGRTTEVDLRVTVDAATAATLEVTAGRRSAQAALDLQPARALRLQWPVEAADLVAVDLTPAQGPALHRELRLLRSESPILAVGLASGDTARLEGFHSIVVAADDVPRNASAFASIDALLIDAPTLDGLDARQLGALLARAAACDRIVVLNIERAARRALDGAAGCGGRPLMSADSLPEALDLLRSSLATSQPRPLAFAGIGELTRPDLAAWHQVAVMLGVYVAAMALLLIVGTPPWVWLLAPALAGVASLAWLQAMPAPTRLLVWSEGDSGAQIARYQGWQRVAGVRREHLRVPLPPQLASGVQACDAAQPMRFDLDPRSGQAVVAEFEQRLFRQVWLCYSGTFPMTRALVIDERSGTREVRNVGAGAWPRGSLLGGGRMYPLPALGAGDRVAVAADTGLPPDSAPLRTASARVPGGRSAALWQLDLGGVSGIPTDAQGWLLVTAAAP